MVIRKAAVVILFVLLCASPALAENKLLPTDILDAKQVEAAITFSYEQGKDNYTVIGFQGSEKWDLFSSICSLGLGLGSGFEINVALPYIITNKAEDEFAGFTDSDDGNGGFEDITLTGKYLILDERKYPLALVMGLGVKFNTAKATGPISYGSSTDFRPFLTASKKIGANFIPYISYSTNIRGDNNYQDSHAFLLGSEFKLNQDVSLIPELSVRFLGESEKWSSCEEYAFRLSGSIQAFRNFYLIPSVSISTATDYRYKSSSVPIEYTDEKSFSGALSFYYLW